MRSVVSIPIASSKQQAAKGSGLAGARLGSGGRGPRRAPAAPAGRQYYVKWASRSFHHCAWVDEAAVRERAEAKLRHFLKSREMAPPGCATAGQRRDASTFTRAKGTKQLVGKDDSRRPIADPDCAEGSVRCIHRAC